MKIEDKVVSLETAKRLKENGFPQEAEREWVTVDGDCALEYSDSALIRDYQHESFAAPDSQEILAQLPFEIEVSADNPAYLYVSVDKDKYRCGYGTWGDIDYNDESQSSEAEARAACWLWLKENKLI